MIKANKLHREKQVVVPDLRLRTVLVWCHTTAQQHAGGAGCLSAFQQLFFTRVSKTKIRKSIQEVTESCRICIECKQNTCADRGLVGALPIPELGNQILYVDLVKVPKFGGFNYILMVCCALTRLFRVYPWTKRIDGEQVFVILFKEWIQVYCRLVEVYSDNDVRFTSEKGYWRGLLSRMGVRVHFGIPNKPSSNGLCKRLKKSVINIMRVPRRQQKGKDWPARPGQATTTPQPKRNGQHKPTTDAPP